jgi:H+/Cl- antiporter ClcA
MIAAAGFGFIGVIVVAIFGPLAFPLSLSDSSHAENAVLVLMLIAGLLFAVSGVVLCWKITSRWVR